MPTKIAELNWKTETDEIKLKKCVVAPITYMEQYKEEISSAAIHVEWKKKYLKNEKKTNICDIMPHCIGDAWNVFLLFKENRMGNDR